MAELFSQGIRQERVRQKEHLQDTGKRTGSRWYRHLRSFGQRDDELLVRAEAQKRNLNFVDHHTILS